MSVDFFPEFIQNNYEIHEWKHASTILHGDFIEEWSNILEALIEFRLKKSWIIVGGGRKSVYYFIFIFLQSSKDSSADYKFLL